MFLKLIILLAILAFDFVLVGISLDLRFLYLAGWTSAMGAVLLFVSYCLYHRHTNFKYYK